MVGELDLTKETQPFFIYKRLELTEPTVYFFYQLDYGFWYLLRRVHTKYPELDSQGSFGPTLRLEFYQMAQTKTPQNVPIPDVLFCTPSSRAVQIDPAGMTTATQPKNAKLQNIVYAFRDNIQIKVTGQDLTNPKHVDIMLVGYQLPAGRRVMWEGSHSGSY